MDDGMTKFRVGDRVRSKQHSDWGEMLVEGYPWGDVFAPVSCKSINNIDGIGAFEESDLILIEDSGELTILRQFRDRALAKYPDLAEAETDEEAAERIAQGMIYGNDDTVSRKRIERLIADGIAWARANPR
jgi:hypothetical protein